MRFPPLALLGLALALTMMGGCRETDTPSTTKRTVLVQIVGNAQDQGIVFPGEIRARHETDLAFRVGGKITRRLVDPGMPIQPGQALATLDPADLKLATAAAAAQLAAAESELRTAQAERNRQAELLGRKFISQTAFDLKENALQAARARVDQARAQHQISTHQGNYGTLSSDHAGIVSAVLVDAGQVVSAGQPVIRVARPEDKEMLIAVPESRLADIRAAKAFTVNAWATPKTAIEGRLRELTPVADPLTRTYAARIRLINPPDTLQLGMSASATVLGLPPSGLDVPLGAVLDHGQGPFVWTVKGDVVTRTAVDIARFDGAHATIRQGLQAGDMLVVAGTTRLTEGETVHPERITPAAEQR